MKKLLLAALVCIGVAANQGCGGNSSTPPPNPQPGPLPTVTLTSVASGFSSPLALVQPNDGSGRLLVVQQGGAIRIIQNGTVLASAFLDITSRISSGGEKGLLGLAFHPQFPQNPRFYVNYTRLQNSQLQSVIAEYSVSAANPNQSDPSTERILLVLDQPFDNHNGGQLAFGPDGFLYIGFGDGGSGGDPQGNGQNKNVLLGKILRIDVNGTSGTAQYRIPSDNPFAQGGGAPEVWAYGLRNPWRFSFDSAGRLFCADVGQGSWEEVDIIQRAGNYGWNTMEGAHCFNPSGGCNQSGLIMPIAEYDHSEGTAVIGGYVYRGAAIPALQGSYVFGDFTGGKIWALREASPGSWTRSVLLTTSRTISSFGQDQAGEIYVVDYSGIVLKLAAQ